MFGFGGSDKEGDRSLNNSNDGSKDKDRSVSGPSKSGGGGMSPSERNAQGREGTNSGPGNPGHTASTSGGREYGGYGSREGQRAGPGNPSASGSAPGKSDRGGGTSVGANAKEGDRSLSMGMDPSRFGGTRSTVGTVGADARESDRSLSAGIDPSRFGRTGAGMGASPASTDMAEARRADENRSMGMLNAAVANSAANAQRADAASTARAAENTSMAPYHEALNNFLGITRQAEAGVADPYNTLSGGKKADVTSMTIDQAAEYAKQKWSGKTANVLGGYQFKDTTLTGIADDLGIPRDTLMTPDVQSKLAIGLAQRRANHATVDGKIDKDKFAREMAREWASFATAATGASFYDSNGIDKAGVSYGEVKAMTDGLVDTGVVGPGRSLGSLGDDPSLTASATGTSGTAVASTAPANRFASTYMGTANPKTREEAYFGDVPSGISDDESASNIQMQEQRRQEAAAAPEDATPKSASYTPDPSLTEFPDRPRTTGEKVAAAGIDIGAGLIPGIGMGIGLINGGLALTGNRTLGEHIVDAIATGDGKYTPGAPGDPNRPESKPEESTVVASTTTAPATDFADRYLAFVDNTKRPTPAEKWSDPNAPYTL